MEYSSFFSFFFYATDFKLYLIVCVHVPVCEPGCIVGMYVSQRTYAWMPLECWD